MVVAAKYPPPYFDQAHGALGFTVGLGQTRIGATSIGLENAGAGIYRIYRGRSGLVCFQYPFYMQWAPRTANQLAKAQTFASGMAEWAELTPEQKEEYKQKAKNLRMHGVNLFMREWMLSH